MGHNIEGIRRPDIFQECKTCPIASKYILQVSKRGTRNITVKCRETHSGFGPIKLGKTAMKMKVVSQPTKLSQDRNDLIKSGIDKHKPLTFNHYSTLRKDVTEKCPGLASAREE